MKITWANILLSFGVGIITFLVMIAWMHKKESEIRQDEKALLTLRLHEKFTKHLDTIKPTEEDVLIEPTKEAKHYFGSVSVTETEENEIKTLINQLPNQTGHTRGYGPPWDNTLIFEEPARSLIGYDDKIITYLKQSLSDETQTKSYHQGRSSRSTYNVSDVSAYILATIHTPRSLALLNQSSLDVNTGKYRVSWHWAIIHARAGETYLRKVYEMDKVIDFPGSNHFQLFKPLKVNKENSVDEDQ